MITSARRHTFQHIFLVREWITRDGCVDALSHEQNAAMGFPTIMLRPRARRVGAGEGNRRFR